MSAADNELVRLKQLTADYEEANGLPQRTLLYSTSPKGTEADRTYVFGAGVRFHGAGARAEALAHLRALAREYGLIGGPEGAATTREGTA